MPDIEAWSGWSAIVTFSARHSGSASQPCDGPVPAFCPAHTLAVLADLDAKAAQPRTCHHPAPDEAQRCSRLNQLVNLKVTCCSPIPASMTRIEPYPSQVAATR